MKGNHSRNYILIVTIFITVSFLSQAIGLNSFGLSPEVVSGPSGAETGTREMMVQTAEIRYEEAHESKRLLEELDTVADAAGLMIDIEEVLTIVRKTLLEDKNMFIRVRAAVVLSQIGIKDEEVMHDLFVVSDDDSLERVEYGALVKEAAKDALANLKKPPEERNKYIYIDYLNAVLENLTDIRETLLDGGYTDYANRVARSLGKSSLNLESLIPDLRKSLFKNKYAGNSVLAARALGELGVKDKGIITDLRKAFEDGEDSPTRTAAMGALGLLGGRDKAMEYIRFALKDKDSSFGGGSWAVEDLYRLGAKAEAINYLITTFNNLNNEKKYSLDMMLLDLVGDLLEGEGISEKLPPAPVDKTPIRQSVNKFHKTKIEIITAKSLKLTDTMQRTINEVNDANRKEGDTSDTITINSLNKGPLLNALRRQEDPSVKRIIMADSTLAQEISELMQDSKNLKMFRDVRVMQINMPKKAYIAKRAHFLGISQETVETAYQSEALEIAILARLLEFKNGVCQTRSVQKTLESLLADTLNADIKLNKFFQKLGTIETDSTALENIRKRLRYFIDVNNAVSLAKEFQRSLFNTREFWKYA